MFCILPFLYIACPTKHRHFSRIIGLAEILTNCPTVIADNDPARAIGIHFDVAFGILCCLKGQHDLFSIRFHELGGRSQFTHSTREFEGLAVQWVILL